MKAVVDRERCVGCGSCAEVCISNAIRMVGGKAEVLPERCVGCATCVGVCPQGAIRMAVLAVPAPAPVPAPAAAELDSIKMQLDAIAAHLEWMKERIKHLESGRG
ncbi:MAG: 4Fe-4S binding protein [Candidatus Alkanophagales archaeon]